MVWRLLGVKQTRTKAILVWGGTEDNGDLKITINKHSAFKSIATHACSAPVGLGCPEAWWLDCLYSALLSGPTAASMWRTACVLLLLWWPVNIGVECRASAESIAGPAIAHVEKWGCQKSLLLQVYRKLWCRMCLFDSIVLTQFKLHEINILIGSSQS